MTCSGNFAFEWRDPENILNGYNFPLRSFEVKGFDKCWLLYHLPVSGHVQRNPACDWNYFQIASVYYMIFATIQYGVTIR